MKLRVVVTGEELRKIISDHLNEYPGAFMNFAPVEPAEIDLRSSNTSPGRNAATSIVAVIEREVA